MDPSPQVFQAPQQVSQPNNNITQTFILKHHQPNLKVYISYRSADDHSQQFVSYDMNSQSSAYQRNLVLERIQTYEYYYSVEINGKLLKESGIRLFRYDEITPYEIDEWNSVWVNYVIETKNQDLFNKVHIEIVGEGVKLRLKNQDPNFQQVLQLGNERKVYEQKASEKISLEQQNSIRQFSFLLQESKEEPHLCNSLRILEHNVIKMNQIFFNFDSSQLVTQNLAPTLKKYLEQSIELSSESELRDKTQTIEELKSKLQKAREELRQRQSGLKEETDRLQVSLSEYQSLNEEYLSQIAQQNLEFSKIEENKSLKEQIQIQQQKYKQLQAEHESAKEKFEELIKQKQRDFDQEKLKSTQNLQMLIQKDIEHNQALKKHYELIQKKETELQQLKNENQFLLQQSQSINKDFESEIIKYKGLLKEKEQGYKALKQTKDDELKLYKERQQVQTDELKAKLDQAYKQLKHLQDTLQKQEISENQIPQLCIDLFNNQPQNIQEDLFQTLKSYEDKMCKMKQTQINTEETIKYQDEKLLQLAVEKKKICEDCSQTVSELESKINKLQIDITDTQESLGFSGMKIKLLKEQLAQQTKQLKALQQNYDLLVQQLGEQIQINQELKEKCAKDQADFNKKEKQIQQELKQQEEEFLKQKEQLEKEQQILHEKLEQQRLKIEQQQEELKKQTEQEVASQQKKIQEKEEEIAELKKSFCDLQNQQQNDNLILKQKMEQEQDSLIKDYAKKLVNQQELMKDKDREIQNIQQKLKKEQEQYELKQQEQKQQEQFYLKKITRLEQDVSDNKKKVEEKEIIIKSLQIQMREQQEKIDSLNPDKLSEQDKRIYTQYLEKEKELRGELHNLNLAFSKLTEIKDLSDQNEIQAFLNNIKNFCDGA